QYSGDHPCNDSTPCHSCRNQSDAGENGKTRRTQGKPQADLPPPGRYDVNQQNVNTAQRYQERKDSASAGDSDPDSLQHHGVGYEVAEPPAPHHSPRLVELAQSDGRADTIDSSLAQHEIHLG